MLLGGRGKETIEENVSQSYILGKHTMDRKEMLRHSDVMITIAMRLYCVPSAVRCFYMCHVI